MSKTRIIGYSLDAYDVKRNIIVEYDEPKHEDRYQKQKDVIRQNRLLNYTQGKFFRYSEKWNRFYEVKNNCCIINPKLR